MVLHTSLSSIILAKSWVLVAPDGETKLFDISAGVLQGDTLAPFLFIIVLDYAMAKNRNWVSPSLRRDQEDSPR